MADTLAELAALDRERPAAVVRELTKLHEEVWRGTLGEAAVADAAPRGEYVLVVEGAPAPAAATDEAIEAALGDELRAGVDRRSAVASVAGSLGVPKRRVYEAALRLRR